MNAKGIRSQINSSSLIHRIPLQRGLAFGVIIITALLAFELFNYSTTDFALTDLLGDLSFMGIRWATILSIAFCGIDFAGIARLFTPEEGADEPKEVWYLFGAWMLAAVMNAMLTWWGVSLAIINHDTLGNAVVDRSTLLRVVPIFVAVLVWLIRVLIIGTFSVAGDRLFSQAEQHARANTRLRVAPGSRPVRSLTSRAPTPQSMPRTAKPLEQGQAKSERSYNRGEPTYHPVMSAKPSNQQNPATNRFSNGGPQKRF